MIDTIEDAPWPTFAEQNDSFQAFDRFLTQKPTREECSTWAEGIAQQIPEGERLLLDDAHEILSDFHRLPLDVRAALFSPIRSMSRGMRFYMERTLKQGELRLHDLSDVNRYCFFVAGVVGEMLTNLLRTQTSGTGSVRLTDAFRFGLFLQKVNLLKDQASDEPQGRFLIPSRSLVRESLLADAVLAFRYLISIPREAESFRLFCAWSLYLGLASLPWIDQAASEKKSLKISRDETFSLLAKVEAVILDDEALRILFEELLNKASSDSGPSDRLQETSICEDQSYVDLYEGALTKDQLLSIFHGLSPD